MTVTQTTFDLDPASLTGPLGAHHHVRFAVEGPELLVHFATAPKGMDADHHHSALEVQARQRGWSLLTIIAEFGHDFRAPDVIAFFDRCVDGAVFDQFEETLFYGDQEGGYAALCYALAAPAARIVTVMPKAPDQILEARYLPEAANLAVASRLVWLTDPTSDAAMTPDPPAQVVRNRFLEPGPEKRLLRYGAFWALLDGAMNHGVAASQIHSAIRARRGDRLYIRRLAAQCISAKKFSRAAVVTGSFAKRTGHKRFRDSYAKMIEEHDLKGFSKI